jgi:hypothetical protein
MEHLYSWTVIYDEKISKMTDCIIDRYIDTFSDFRTKNKNFGIN